MCHHHKFVEFQLKSRRAAVEFSCSTLLWISMLFPLGFLEKQWKLLLSNDADVMLAFTLPLSEIQNPLAVKGSR